MGYIEELRAIIGHRPLILVGVAVFIYNAANELLLQKKPSGMWSLPGGLMELGESTEETGRREILEETGLIIGDLKLHGVLSGKDQFVKLQNGDELYPITIAYSTRDIKGGHLTPDGMETIDLKFFTLNQLPEGLNPRYKPLFENLN